MNKNLLIIDVQKRHLNEHTNHIPDFVEKLQYEYENVYILWIHYASDNPFDAIRDRTSFMSDYAGQNLAFEPRPGAKINMKTSYAEHYGSFLEQSIKGSAYPVVDIVGLDTDQAVLATAIKLFDTLITPRILVSGCASTAGPAYQEMGLQIMGRLFGKQNIIA